MPKPKVSFVIPLYNKQAYIGHCLAASVAQTLKEIEIVIVNDASTDDSMEIVNHYAKGEPRIKVFNLKKNMGRSHARNLGNSKATASIICVQDADDISSPHRAELTYNYFKKYPKTDVFYGSFYVGDMLGNPADEITAKVFDIEEVKKTGVTFMGHSTMAYKKSVIMKVPYEGGKWSKLGLDDWKLQIELYKKGYKFGLTQEPLMIYRQASNSISAIRSGTAVYKAKGNYLKTL